MITWFLEKSDDIENLKKEILRQGQEYIIGVRTPFTKNIIWEKSHRKTHLKYPIGFAYGSLQFIEAIRINWSEYNHIKRFCNLPQFKCSYYYPRLGHFLLNSDYCFLPYGELQFKQSWLMDTFGRDGQVFIRPDSGNKPFTGYLIDNRVYKQDIEFFNRMDNIQPEDLCLISSPKKINAEIRCIIGPNGLITGSVYRKYGVHFEIGGLEPSEILFINEVLQNTDFKPDPFWIIDIALANDKYYILEVNSMSCSGLYKCNLEKIVREISCHLSQN